ncbi:aldo/keto reductase [Parafrankia sp. BMG5.11]|uniref:aldo/keto reductase n=1 Tax=Parafrankia sp. BMG5.11 TaxID=222540 RepID=UPI00103D8AD0|nr:aldo/keto reductase [Parafrankia sp. BMG5.11]TCJ37028.1 aldo/keto reductase [Parafrankia sp. BMG5.11]
MSLSKVVLQNTDLTVSEFCYGTNMLGTAIDQAGSNAILDTFAELGGNFIDTARMYGDWVPDAPAGASERAIGTWLASQNRDDFVVATKGCAMDMRKGDWQPRLTPDDLANDVSESLDHLQLQTIDLYFLHADNPQVPVGEMIDALAAHQAAGRVRHYAASNWSADRIASANEYAASSGKPPFVASQTFWGLAKPNVAAAAQQGYLHYYEGEYEELHAAGLPIIAYGAQSGGYFSKLTDGTAMPEGIAARYDDPANSQRYEAARAIASARGISINDVVLAYISSQLNQTIPIFGGRNEEQVRDSVKASSVRLDASELAELQVG